MKDHCDDPKLPQPGKPKPKPDDIPLDPPGTTPRPPKGQ